MCHTNDRKRIAQELMKSPDHKEQIRKQMSDGSLDGQIKEYPEAPPRTPSHNSAS